MTDSLIKRKEELNRLWDVLRGDRDKWGWAHGRGTWTPAELFQINLMHQEIEDIDKKLDDAAGFLWASNLSKTISPDMMKSERVKTNSWITLNEINGQEKSKYIIYSKDYHWDKDTEFIIPVISSSDFEKFKEHSELKELTYLDCNRDFEISDIKEICDNYNVNYYYQNGCQYDNNTEIEVIDKLTPIQHKQFLFEQIKNSRLGYVDFKHYPDAHSWKYKGFMNINYNRYPQLKDVVHRHCYTNIPSDIDTCNFLTFMTARNKLLTELQMDARFDRIKKSWNANITTVKLANPVLFEDIFEYMIHSCIHTLDTNFYRELEGFPEGFIQAAKRGNLVRVYNLYKDLPLTKAAVCYATSEEIQAHRTARMNYDFKCGLEFSEKVIENNWHKLNRDQFKAIVDERFFKDDPYDITELKIWEYLREDWCTENSISFDDPYEFTVEIDLKKSTKTRETFEIKSPVNLKNLYYEFDIKQGEKIKTSLKRSSVYFAKKRSREIKITALRKIKEFLGELSINMPLSDGLFNKCEDL